MSAGLAFSKIATRSGYEIFDYTEYPSIIRGGHNIMQIVIGQEPVRAAVNYTDFLVALNPETVELHKHELRPGAGVIYDSEKCGDEVFENEISGFPIPLVKIARDQGGSEVMRNTVALGATMALLGGDLEILKNLIAEEFGKKGEETVQLNQKVCQAGYDFAKEKFGEKIKTVLGNRVGSKRLVMTGNEAIALGAIAGGMQFTAIYPMTPTSNILHALSPFQEKFGFVYKQPEDEIAGINMAIGAAFAGARTMVATSGGGFCLMAEGYGMAGITETPIVIIEGMRGSPATGLPTWTEQGDLQFILHAHQGEFPRIVLAAGDVEEAFHLTMKAFNLAEKYQTPVVVLVDKLLCESHQSVLAFNYESYQIDRGKLSSETKEGYKRYTMSEDGISPRSVPGVGNHFVANSDEHDEIGFSTEEAEERLRQMDKRMKKFVTCENEDMAAPVLYGPEDAEVTIVSWGSNKGAVLQAMKTLEESGRTVNYLHSIWMNPFPIEAAKARLTKAKHLLSVECNYSGQFANLVREKTGVEISDRLLKYDGRPVYPEEIIEKVKDLNL